MEDFKEKNSKRIIEPNITRDKITAAEPVELEAEKEIVYEESSQFALCNDETGKFIQFSTRFPSELKDLYIFFKEEGLIREVMKTELKAAGGKING